MLQRNITPSEGPMYLLIAFLATLDSLSLPAWRR